MKRNGKPRTIQAVQTSFDIVEVLKRRDGAGVTEIADELHLSKGAVYTHLATLRENEYVVKREGIYRLSLRYLELGEYVKDCLGIYDIIREELDDLAAKTGEVAQFATEEHGRTVYLYKSEGEKAVNTASTVGKREHLHCISLGKAMLAHLPDERVDEIVGERGLPRRTPRTITRREELDAELERVREQGYAIDDEEFIEGLRCIAMPVMASDKTVLGAVSISGPSSRMEGSRFTEELPHLLRRSANIIEINSKFA